MIWNALPPIRVTDAIMCPSWVQAEGPLVEGIASVDLPMGEDDAHFGNDMAEHEGPLPGLT